jgi:hypothetical protein
MLRTWPMLKSILWKELRDLLPLAIIAFASEGLLFGIVAQHSASEGELRDPRIVMPFLYMLGFLFPIAVGLWQISRESLGSNFLFLLHRPLGQRAIFGVKLLFGAVTCLLAIDLPLLVFVLWASHHAHGRLDDQSMSIMFALCCDLFLLYLGAFLSALRPGLWYGSKFLPLLAAILLYALLQDHISWWRWALIVGVPLEISYVAAIIYVAQTRDYS